MDWLGDLLTSLSNTCVFVESSLTSSYRLALSSIMRIGVLTHYTAFQRVVSWRGVGKIPHNLESIFYSFLHISLLSRGSAAAYVVPCEFCACSEG